MICQTGRFVSVGTGPATYCVSEARPRARSCFPAQSDLVSGSRRPSWNAAVVIRSSNADHRSSATAQSAELCFSGFEAATPSNAPDTKWIERAAQLKDA